MRFEGFHKYTFHPDMTPMLDLTFQLTFFFMLALNFSSDIQSDMITLPISEIAKPSEGALETPVTIQILKEGQVLFGGDQMDTDALRGPLRREQSALRSLLGKRKASNATVVIRADRNVPTGKVQDVIRICQDTGFDKFALRARPQSDDRESKP
jgi:biopolymer transport protein ExbD